jgi:pantoate--beta-alanine ligase
MKIISNKLDLSNELNQLRLLGKSIGFVPTMGALHEGHLSLVKYSNNQNDVTVVSIFVNPTQFNDKNDYQRYPRILDNDIKKLQTVTCDYLFTPTEKEMYPENDTREFDFGNLDKVMEGRFRPGHFRGVALIVSKLFEIVNPHRAYFGEKDFQQVAIIKHITRELKFKIEIIPCPILREPDGLAMSSRNMLLSDVERKQVPIISKTLFQAQEKAKKLSVDETKTWVVCTINANPYLKVEYFEIVNDTNLDPVENWKQAGSNVGCIAVHVGNIRLIDNVRFNL